MKIVECPYCHKKVSITRGQLMFRGRLSLLCPACHRFLYYAVRKRLLAMQAAMITASVLLLTGMANIKVPFGGLGKAFMLIAGLAMVMALSEITQDWISRPSLVKQETERLVAKKKAEEAAQKEAERAANKKKHQHKKKK